MERGKMALFHFTPKVFHFAPLPWSGLAHANSTYENFSDKIYYSVLEKGSKFTAAIGLDNELLLMQHHIIILICAHIFPFVHIRKRYNVMSRKMQKLSVKFSKIL